MPATNAATKDTSIPVYAPEPIPSLRRRAGSRELSYRRLYATVAPLHEVMIRRSGSRAGLAPRPGGCTIGNIPIDRRPSQPKRGIESSGPSGPGPREPSAAQNGTVIQICKQCGAVYRAETTQCTVCRALFSPEEHRQGVGSRGVGRTEGSLAMAPDWRSEVSFRLQEYRKRQRRLRHEPAQPKLTFGEEANVDAGPTVARPAASVSVAPAVQPMPRRVHRVERVEIDLLQPSLDFSGAPALPSARGASDWHVSLVSPMASLRERRLAALLDAALILFAYGSFLALFSALGGRFSGSRLDVAVLLATLGLFYGQYFALFTLFGGATPGMLWRGLRLATFDGGDPQMRDLAWRSFGYLISACTLMLGFLWALWDEERLCWHDRISHTHLTSDRRETVGPRASPGD